MLKEMDNQKSISEAKINTIEDALMNDYEELKGEKALVDQDNLDLQEMLKEMREENKMLKEKM